MTVKQIKRVFIIASLLLIAGVLAFTGMLNISSFRDHYVRSLMNSQAVVAGETVRKIEYAVKYGKPLDNFHGMEAMLRAVQDQLTDIDNVAVILPDGTQAYALTESPGRILPENLMHYATFSQHGETSFQSTQYEDLFHVYLPVRNEANEWLGSLELTFSEALVASQVQPYLRALTRTLVVLTLVAAAALVLVNLRISPVTAAGTINRKRLLVMMLAVIGTAQVLFGAFNYQLFRQAYVDQTRANTIAVAAIIQRDVQAVLEKGVGYHQFYEMERYMSNIAASLPEIDTIRITDAAEARVLYGTTREEAGQPWVPGESQEMAYEIALPAGTEGLQPALQVAISETYLSQRLREIILDALTVLVTSTFFMVELTFFLLIYLSRRIEKVAQPLLQEAETREEQGVSVTVIRTMAFIVFIAIFMSSSFIPVLMKSIYRPVAGLSENLVLGLPLSVNFLLGALATLMAGSLIEKIGWRITFFMGLAVLGAGTFLSGLVGHPLTFVLIRGLTGAGYGLTLMAMRGYVLTLSSDRDGGYASLNAGIYSGMNCGVVMGAMLAERIAYRGVFFASVAVIALAAAFVYLYTSHESKSGKQQAAVPAQTSLSTSSQVIPPAQAQAIPPAQAQAMAATSPASPATAAIPSTPAAPASVDSKAPPFTLRSFLTNPSILVFFGAILLPTAACIMFLDYFFPLLTQELNVSIAHVGRAFLLNGLCIVYLGPVITKTLGKRMKVHSLVFMGALSTAGAMLVFALGGNLMAAFAAAFLLGVADSFGLVAQTNYLLGLKASQNLGRGLSLGYYSNIKKIGQMMGPLIFGAAISMGSRQGVGLIGVTVLVLALVFVVSQRSSQRRERETLTQ